ncbi:lysoplasmalogenase TMEM86A [Cloeon dipterum]|uniref:lysoplasmalogenase TMEM86A n=1 Tax=Cloeon dipterum TaxID=197152 RepID=UPI00321FA9B4
METKNQQGGPAAFIRETLISLIPFLKCTIWYFIIWNQTPGLWNAVLKVLPVFSLLLFIYLRGKKEHKWTRWIVLGLLVSTVGDVFMVWRSQLVNGMAAFALAQICYIKAFGFTPLKPAIGVILYLGSFGALALLIPGLRHDTFLLVGLPFYSVLLSTMAWRANARFFAKERTCKWIRLSAAIGSLSFLISDMIIGFDRFYSPIPDAQVYIMSTYYVAQLGIALSAAEPLPSQKRKNN